SSLHGEFVFDDNSVILSNPQLLNLKTLGDVFQFTGVRGPLYITYGLNFYLGGLNPYGYHLLNVGLHALNAIIVFYILLELGPTRWAGLAGAAIFAVHPIETAAASYIAGRSSLLSGTSYFLAFLLFLKGVRSSKLIVRVLFFFATGAMFLVAFST